MGTQARVETHGWRVARSLAIAVVIASCGDGGGRDSNGFMSATTAGSAAATGGSTGAEAPTTTGASSDGTSAGTSAGTTAITGATSIGPTSDATTGGPTTDPPGTSSGPGSTTGFVPEYFMMTDPLVNGTMGVPVGGSFGDDGWTTTGEEDVLYWALPRLAEGSVTFTVANITLANLPHADQEIFALYEGGYGIEHPINYSPEFRQNAYKSMIRIYGVAEPERTGQQKIMWGICPLGAGWHEAGCPCTNPVGFFEEPFGGDPNWDGSPQTLKIEWKDGVTRYSRNDVETLTVDWSGSGFVFGPQELYVSLGTSRPDGPMPIGAVFSDVVIEGWTGPETPVCGQ